MRLVLGALILLAVCPASASAATLQVSDGPDSNIRILVGGGTSYVDVDDGDTDANVSVDTLQAQFAAGDVALGDTDPTSPTTAVRIATSVAGAGGLSTAVPVTLAEGVTVAVDGELDFASSVTSIGAVSITADDVTTGAITAAGDVRLTATRTATAAAVAMMPGDGTPALQLRGTSVVLGAAEPTTANRLTLPDDAAVTLDGVNKTVGLHDTYDKSLDLGSHLRIPAGERLTAAGDLSIATPGWMFLDRPVSAGGRLRLAAQMGLVQTAAAQAPALSVVGGGIVELGNAGNALPRIDGLTAVQATVASVGGIDLAGDVTLPSSALALNLSAGGAITQSGGRILASRLAATAGGAITLDADDNDLEFLDAVKAGGDIAIHSDGTAVAGTVDAGSAAVRIDTDNLLNIGLNAVVRGRDVVLTTGGRFVNNRRNEAIEASRRWLVYLGDLSASRPNGLDSGSPPRWNATPATVPPSSVTGNRYLIAEQPVVTFRSEDASKVFGTTAVPPGPFTVSGVRPALPGAYTAGTAYTGAPALTSLGSPANAGVAGSPYPIGISPGTLLAQDGYALAFASTGRLGVLPAGQTIVFDQPADGVAGATFAVAPTGGGSSAPVTVVSESPAICTVKDRTVTLVAAGTCRLTAGQAGDDDHREATPVTRSLSVAAAPTPPADTAPGGGVAGAVATAPRPTGSTTVASPCTSRRFVTLNVRRPKHARRTIATLGKQRLRTRTTRGGRSVAVRVDLRGKPAGRYRAIVRFRLASGRTKTVRVSVLRTCARG